MRTGFASPLGRLGASLLAVILCALLVSPAQAITANNHFIPAVPVPEKTAYSGVLLVVVQPCTGLFGADNPVNMVDPSGHDFGDFSLGGSLDSMLMPVFSALQSSIVTTLIPIQFYESPGYYSWAKKPKIDKWDHGNPPANSKTLTTLDGETFFAPNEIDFNDELAAGKANGQSYVGISSAVGPFGKYDFQRNRGKGVLDVNTEYPAYIHAGNYGVGVYMYGCTFTLAETIKIGHDFASWFSSNPNDPDLPKWWTLGWNAAQAGTPNGTQKH